MAKKKQTRTPNPNPLPAVKPTNENDSAHAQVALDNGSSRGLGKGNTAEMAKMFDDILDSSDLAILKGFPSSRKELVVVLRSIHGDSLRLQSRKTVWGQPVLGFEVDLHALSDASIFARLDVDLPPAYPKVPPVVRLTELEPDTASLRQDLKDVIAVYEKRQFDDESVVEEILGGIQEKLDDLYAMHQRRAKGSSLEEERATTEYAAKVDATLQQELADRRREAENAAVEAKLAQDFESQTRRRKLLSSDFSTAEETTTASEEYPAECIVFDHDMTLRNASFEAGLTFRAVQPMSLLYQRDGKRVTIACPFHTGKLIQVQLVLKEVRLPPGVDSEVEERTVLAQIETALQEAKTFEHSAIVKIYDYKLTQVSDRNLVSHWELFILTEHAQQSLDTLLDMVGGLSAVKLRIYARSILDALEYYDRKGYVHPAIHAHNILLFGSEHSTYQAKISDGYGTALRRLVDRVQNNQASDPNQGNWAPPEVIGGRSARSNKTCIWELGVVLLKMALGNEITKAYTSPEDALAQAELDQDFDHLVASMCSTSARKRPTAFQVQSFQFFKSHEYSVFQSQARKQTNIPHFTRARSVVESRWASEWEPVDKLGEGGFGTVFKARHRLDGQFYAVKRLRCKSVRDSEDIWGEVRMLAKLNHPGIVRYFLAWSEEDNQDATDTDTSTALTDPRSFAPPTDSHAPRISLIAGPSTGHDFMDPSLARLCDLEDDEDEQDKSDSSDDGNMFGYQSAPSASADNSQAIECEGNDQEEPSDPFELQLVADTFDDEPNFFETDSATGLQERTDVPSRPQPFIVAKGTPSAIRRPPQYYNKNSTLHIQMELCETGTLLDLIREGLPDRIEDSWRIFRLLLDGLEYIHEQNIVHRDLKPTNIFIDSQNMPKIGDFGLASASQATVDGHKLATHVAGPLSKGVGTTFYIAPELEDSRSAGKYSTKADMFALGVIFFEMCFGFKTSTERIKWMQKINKDASVLPSRFEKQEYAIQGRIIKSLLDHNQTDRPSAKQLLLDPEIPEPLEEDKERRYFQRLVQGDPQQFQAVMKNFMSKEASRPQLLAYAHIDQEDFDKPDQYLLNMIQCKLGEVFSAHGAVEKKRETVFPVEGLYPNAVKFLDAAGFTVQLPYDLTLPFARYIAVSKPEYEKSSSFGTVYRQRAGIGEEPMCLPEVDFDIVSYSAQDLSLRDAQVISVLDDCLAKVAPLFTRTFSVVISHGDLLDLILRASEVPEGRFEVVKRILSNLNLGKTTWKQVQLELQSSPAGLTVTTVAALAQFNFSCSFDEMRQGVLSGLRKLKKDDSILKATRTLNRLREVNEYLNRMRVRTTVLFSPLSNTSESLYRGSVMFKCVESKTLRAVIVGGRYDALIRNYHTPTHKTFARAAGFRVNVMDLASYTRSDGQSSSTRTSRSKFSIPLGIPPRIDVVITSFDEATLYGSCIELVRDLLDASISVELSQAFASMEELDQAYSTVSRYWVVIVRGTKIKVRSPSKDETDVPPSELVSFLRDELGDRQTSSTSEPILRRTRSSHGAGDRENVVILTPQHKSKKVNRASIVDSARTAAQEVAETISKLSKVLAIDTDDETLQRIRNTRLTDGDSWRALRQSVALTERDYIQEIQGQLQDWGNDGQEGAFLCNYKTKKCVFYDLGKS